MSTNMQSAFEIIARQPWAITPETLEMMCSIAQRENPSIEALEAKMGRPLVNTRDVRMRGGAAIIPVTGPIFRYANLFTQISGATSLDVLAREFNTALESPDVSRIILNFDTPGGQATGIADFAHMIRNRTIRKPVIAFVENAMSAGYWIASAADQIVMHKTSLVGSIGAVISINTDSKKNGTIEIVSSQSPKKLPDVKTSEGRSQIQALIDSLAQVFIEDVAAYRDVPVSTVLEKFGQGDVRMGVQAIASGMADKLATLEELIASFDGPSGKSDQSMQQSAIAAQAIEEPVLTFEQQAIQDWKSSEEIRAEFGTFNTYLHFKLAESKNIARVQSNHTFNGSK